MEQPGQSHPTTGADVATVARVASRIRAMKEQHQAIGGDHTHG